MTLLFWANRVKQHIKKVGQQDVIGQDYSEMSL